MKPTAHFRKVLVGVVAGGLIGTVAAAPAAAAPDLAQSPAPAASYLAVPAPLVHILPVPLACLATTGSALFCLGIT